MRWCISIAVLAVALLPDVGQFASVTGRVVTTDQEPVAVVDVVVSLDGASGIYRVTTDESGAFRFAGLPAGSYLLRVSKAGYVTTEFGALQTGGEGSALRLANDDHVEAIVSLPRAARVSGTIRGPDGDPAPDVIVAITSSSGPASQVWTDRRGEYRFYDLLPGDYVISARAHGGLARFLYPAVSMSAAQLDATLKRLEARSLTDDRNVSEVGPPVVGMPTVYYPGTVDPTVAATIALGEGVELGGIDLGLVVGGTSKLFGRLVGHTEPVGRGSQLLAVNDLSNTSYGGAFDAAAGTFTFSNLPPGTYTIRVRVLAPSEAGASPFAAAAQVSSWGRAAVHVSGDTADVIVQLRPPITIRGVIQPDAESAGSPVPPVQLEVDLRGELSVGTVPTVSAVSRPDGTFALEGVVPGRYRFGVRGVAADGGGWKLRAADMRGLDLLAPFEVVPESGDISGVVLQVSTRSTTLSGRLVGTEGQPVSEYYVLAFPTDSDRWLSGSRRLLLTRPGQDGLYSFPDIPEGEYHVAALTARPANWQSREFLESVVPLAVKVMIGHGQMTTLDLQVVR